METLPQTTVRRLKRIPQIPSVWEGDRRPLAGMEPSLEPAPKEKSDCIIWVDGSEGAVRAMDVISPEMGQEAVVRTLLRAIESPHSPGRPARPQKIIVKDRQIQFFLRGALQDLDIAIDYAPDLPLIDELFRSFEAISGDDSTLISSQIELLLRETAESLWNDAPALWDLLAEHDVICLEINHWDVGNLYACVMGMLGKDYGVILYRSLESLKRFRYKVCQEQGSEDLEQAFLSQDCWFLNYEADQEDFEFDEDDDDDEDFDLCELDTNEIRPLLGSIHPYEGMRPLRDEEEAMVIYVAIKAMQSFFRQSQADLALEVIPELHTECDISLPPSIQEKEGFKSITVKVSTMPDLASELFALSEDEEFDEDDDEEFEDEEFEEGDYEEFDGFVGESLIPRDAYLSVEILPWQLLEQLGTEAQLFQIHRLEELWKANIDQTSPGMPVILIQTSRPKALELIKRLNSAGGLTGISFYPKIHHNSGVTYLGILETGNGYFYSMGPLSAYDPDYYQNVHMWNQFCQETQGYCGLLVAMGITGASRGKPQIRDWIALFETKAF